MLWHLYWFDRLPLVVKCEALRLTGEMLNVLYCCTGSTTNPRMLCKVKRMLTEENHYECTSCYSIYRLSLTLMFQIIMIVVTGGELTMDIFPANSSSVSHSRTFTFTAI